ncbi:hypothetical protein J6590_013538 [Homalodisca vitripennis]|nr:hypothetical protein J6590_013538 [Homalodisca vitripennis]
MTDNKSAYPLTLSHHHICRHPGKSHQASGDAVSQCVTNNIIDIDRQSDVVPSNAMTSLTAKYTRHSCTSVLSLTWSGQWSLFLR